MVWRFKDNLCNNSYLKKVASNKIEGHITVSLDYNNSIRVYKKYKSLNCKFQNPKGNEKTLATYAWVRYSIR